MANLKIAGLVLALGVAGAMLTACSGDSANAAGTWGSGGEGQPQLVLAEDGALSGTDGCNQLVGAWSETDDGGVDFGNVGVTQKQCDGVDDWLSKLATATVEDDVLHVFNGDGEEIGTLDRE